MLFYEKPFLVTLQKNNINLLFSYLEQLHIENNRFLIYNDDKENFRHYLERKWRNVYCLNPNIHRIYHSDSLLAVLQKPGKGYWKSANLYFKASFLQVYSVSN